MEKKYKTKKEGNMLRIIALKDFAEFEKGQLGGLIEKEENLSQEGNCWICPNAKVYGDARVYDNAMVWNEAEIYGHAEVFEEAQVYGNASVWGNAKVFGWAEVSEIAEVYGDAWVYGNALVDGTAEVRGNVKLHSPSRTSINNFSTKDSKDHVILAIKKDFYTFTLSTSATGIDYLKNIQTIRQIYGKEI